MVNIAIVEDNLSHSMRLESTLYDISKEITVKLNIESSATIKEYREHVFEKTTYDLYFLDLEIDNDKNKGFELAKEIRGYNPYAVIVFITTLSEAMPLVFRNHVSALDFITKDNEEPVFRKRVKECLEYVLDKGNNIDEQEILSYSYEGRAGISMPFSDILIIKTTGESHRLVVFGTNFRKEFYGTIADILELDTINCLRQVDRSTIINVENVIDINKKDSEVLFFEGTTCHVSRLRIREISKRLKASLKKE